MVGNGSGCESIGPAAFASRGESAGIAGQMHGATLLDEQQKVLRPAILWNDGRCGEECVMLENQVPQSRAITAT